MKVKILSLFFFFYLISASLICIYLKGMKIDSPPLLFLYQYRYIEMHN